MESPSVKSKTNGAVPDALNGRRNTPTRGLAQVPRTLSGVEENAWQLLRKGTRDRRSPFHTLTVATLAGDGMPDLRVVVLREVDRVRRVLRFNTDVRAPKFQQITANPRLALQGHDAHCGVALRIAGIARTEVATERVRQIWDDMKEMSRECYRVGQPPSTPILSPDDSPLDTYSQDEAFQNFALVDVTLTRIEWLYLKYGGHMRARLDWPVGASEDSAPEATWLVA